MEKIVVKPNKEGQIVIKMFGKEYEIVIDKGTPKAEEKPNK